MTRQLQLLEMQQYIVEQRLCRLSGNVNLTAWYMMWHYMFCSLRLLVPACKLQFLFDKKLLIGTADGGIKAWNVDAKRVVCDLNTTEAFPRYFDNFVQIKIKILYAPDSHFCSAAVSWT